MSGTFDFVTMPQFETERVVLRAVDPAADLDALFQIFGDPAVAQFIDTGPFTEMAEAESLLEWMQRIFRERRGLRWVIESKGPDKSVIGTCGFHNMQSHNDSAEIGYDLTPASWGRGLMVEALTPMLSFGFHELGLHRIEAGVTVGNDASARVLEKLGFTEEGLIRAGGYWRNEYQDLRFFGLLRSDWEA